MAIASLADLRASLRHRIYFHKSTVSGTFTRTSTWALGALPAAGSAPGNTTTGAVPTSSTTGAPSLISFGSGTGYIVAVDAHHSVGDSGQMHLLDRLFHCGAFTNNSTSATLASQPSYSSRVPGGTDFTGTQLWWELATGSNSTFPVTVTYTNQSGVTGRSTGAVTVGGTNLTSPFCQQLPLQAGDTGVQTIESVTMSGAAGGTSNIVVARPLWHGYAKRTSTGNNQGVVLFDDFDRTGLPQIYDTSCLWLVAGDNTANNASSFDLMVELAIY